MIALDTSVVVRYLVQDHPEQSVLAARFIEGELTSAQPGFLGAVTVCELIWVLDRMYKQPRETIARTLLEMLDAPQLEFEAAGVIRAAVAQTETGIADAIVHLTGAAHGCARTVTFDRKFARLEGVEVLGD